jgi:hypothetical protein
MRMARSASLVTALVVPWLGLASPASAAEVVAAGCVTAYVGAIEGDVLVNGPVHLGGPGGAVSVGPFTPSTFVSGATGPTTVLVTCV